MNLSKRRWNNNKFDVIFATFFWERKNDTGKSWYRYAKLLKKKSSGEKEIVALREKYGEKEREREKARNGEADPAAFVAY